MFSFLPSVVIDALKQYDIENICEIRLRANAPIFIFINKNWLKIKLKNGYTITDLDLENTFLKLCEHSVYAHIDTIKQGYITTNSGVRVGISGQVVKEKNEVKIIKNITSLCIRIPHEIKGCAKKICDTVFSGGLRNLLIISPPGFGKTTYLRDIIQYLSNKYNVLCVDERLEIYAKNRFYLGDRTDVLQLASKSYGLDFGIKSMSPDIICIDELSNENDVNSTINACFSGVKVVATIHGKSIEDIRRKSIYEKLILSGAMDNYCILGKKGEITHIGII